MEICALHTSEEEWPRCAMTACRVYCAPGTPTSEELKWLANVTRVLIFMIVPDIGRRLYSEGSQVGIVENRFLSGGNGRNLHA